jgi:hypothetical protein
VRFVEECRYDTYYLIHYNDSLCACACACACVCVCVFCLLLFDSHVPNRLDSHMLFYFFTNKK